MERGGAVNQQTMGIQPTPAMFHVVRHFSLWIYPPNRRYMGIIHAIRDHWLIELEVHSVILELASPVFASMLSSAMKEGTGDSIHLPGKCKSELESFYKALQLCTMEEMPGFKMI